MGNQTNEYPSKQLIEDPFSEIPGYGSSIRVPPFMLEQFALLVEQQPVHQSCIQQKVLDVVGDGPQWVHDLEEDAPQAEMGQAKKIEKWWQSLADEYTALELLQAWWDDYETIGWGFLEIVRDPVKKIVRRLYYVPSHTIRASPDGFRFAQIRHGRVQWFKRWNDPVCYNSKTGRVCSEDTPDDKQANELLVLRRPSRRSQWYGIPTYISAVGFITLAVAARDWNILFFENYREPRHLIVVTGLEEDVAKATDEIENVLKSQANEPHRNLLIELTGDAKVQIERLSLGTEDMDFSKLLEESNVEVTIAHRVPMDRLGLSTLSGSGRGSTAQLIQTINQIYKEGVVQKGQGTLEDRLDRFVRVEFRRTFNEEVVHHANFQELDVEDATASANVVNDLIKNAVITINEGRRRIGEKPLEKFTDPKSDEDYTLPEYLKAIGVSSPSHTGIQFLSPSLLEPDGTFGGPNPEVTGDGVPTAQGTPTPKNPLPIPGPNGSTNGHTPTTPSNAVPRNKTGGTRPPNLLAKTVREPATVAEVRALEAAVQDLEGKIDELLHTRS